LGYGGSCRGSLYATGVRGVEAGPGCRADHAGAAGGGWAH